MNYCISKTDVKMIWSKINKYNHVNKFLNILVHWTQPDWDQMKYDVWNKKIIRYISCKQCYLALWNFTKIFKRFSDCVFRIQRITSYETSLRTAKSQCNFHHAMLLNTMYSLICDGDVKDIQGKGELVKSPAGAQKCTCGWM